VEERERKVLSSGETSSIETNERTAISVGRMSETHCYAVPDPVRRCSRMRQPLLQRPYERAHSTVLGALTMRSGQRSGPVLTHIVMGHLASKWSPSIVLELSNCSRRYSELRTRINGISEKMLAQTLRELERDGLVLRTSLSALPPHVVYSLTPLGEDGVQHISALVAWVQANVDELARAQRAFDAHTPGEKTRDRRVSLAKTWAFDGVPAIVPETIIA
jgi:DNA-binding HxlR family transcriptional regulator